jgi:hypothetical protein
LFVQTSSRDEQVLLAILNVAGMGHAMITHSQGSVNNQLWFIPNARRSTAEVSEALQKLPSVKLTRITAFSKPVKDNELVAVRELLTACGWEASAVSDKELSAFINAKFKSKDPLILDFFWNKKG